LKRDERRHLGEEDGNRKAARLRRDTHHHRTGEVARRSLHPESNSDQQGVSCQELGEEARW
jgi:hypothetical protein